MWVQRTNGTFGRADSALNHRAISPAPCSVILEGRSAESVSVTAVISLFIALGVGVGLLQ